MKQPQVQTGLRLGLVAIVLCTIFCTGCAVFNSPPAISCLAAERDWVAPAGSCEIECFASDADDDSLTYTWSASGGTLYGTGATTTWTAPYALGTYEITVEVTDGQGGKTTRQLPIEVRVNHPVIIENLTTKRPVANRGESISIECIASDADNDSLVYTWSATGGAFYGAGPIITWEAPYALGTYEITVEVTDGQGGKATMQLPIEVGVNRLPIIQSLTAEPLAVNRGETSTIKCLASDPDGDELTYLWTAEDGEFSGQGSIVTWIAPNDCKNYLLAVTVADGRGGEVNRALYIRVRKPG